MWQRATRHECASELGDVCERFRRAYWGRRNIGFGWARHPDDEAEMKALSIQGVQLLRALALAVRSEQDFGVTTQAIDVVGAVMKEDALPADAIALKNSCGYENILQRDGYQPLRLRGALNKIAHADPHTADYYIGPGDRNHDLLLFGNDRGRNWFVAISLLALVKAVHSLPDAQLVAGDA